MATYNGHKNYNQWNQSLWINGDEGLYMLAKDFLNNCSGGKDKAAQNILDHLTDCGITHTPDGVKWSKAGIRAALVGM